MEPNITISLKNVAIYQGDNLILSRVNLDVKKGEHIYLMGKTGSGKSSLLETLYAELPLMDGEAHIAEYDLSKIKKETNPTFEKKIGNYFPGFPIAE